MVRRLRGIDGDGLKIIGMYSRYRLVSNYGFYVHLRRSIQSKKTWCEGDMNCNQRLFDYTSDNLINIDINRLTFFYFNNEIPIIKIEKKYEYVKIQLNY